MVQVMRIPPPVLALIAGLAQRAVTRDSRPTTTTPAVAAAGTALASVVLATASARSFRQRGTTLDPFHPAQASVLVTTGPNAVSRNPMYVGLTGLLMSNAIRLRSWTALLPVAVFVLAIDRLQIRSEESALLAHFGADYEAYRVAVPRWLDRRSVNVRFQAVATETK
jgi:protein-S-isoprenylcysteine O-methyltransferase Ste14